MALAVILTVLAVVACTSPLPTATPTPTPSSVAEEVLEELFWMSVDWVGENSQAPGVNRTLDFDTAKRAVTEFLRTLYLGNISILERHGIVPFETFPYCIDTISGMYHITALTATSSPSEAAPHVDQAIDDIHRVATAIVDSHDVGRGRHDKSFCDRFEAEKREAMGWAPMDGQ